MKNVHYINAGAGAGKTYTLVTILKDILTDENNPCAPSEIILTTYTKAAAKEFREKTFARLLEAPAALDVAKILDTATIGTVHSVAQQYIQRYWSLLGYSGQFNVMSDVDKDRYINKSIKKSATADDISFFYKYVKDFKITKYDSVKALPLTHYDFWKDYVLAIVSKMRAYKIPRNDLDKFKTQSCDVVDRLFVYDFNPTVFQSLAKDYLDFLNDNISKGKGSTKKASEDKKVLYDNFIVQTAFPDEILKAFSTSKFYTYATSIDTNPIAKNSGEESRKYIQKCQVLNSANGARIKNCIKRIFTIAKDWSQKYEEYKRENNLLDFDDLEAKFLELLDIPAVQDDIHSSVKYLFVDEFQDSNPIQLEIFKKLSDLVQVKSYWVGDRKQAIYGFRGSDSTLTTNLLKLFPTPVPGQTSGFVPNADGCTSQLIDTSYRSIRSLVELANEVFEKSFAAGVPTEHINNVPLCVSREDWNITHPIQHWHCYSEDALADRVAEILNGNVTTIPGVYDEGGLDKTDKDKNWRTKIVPADIAILSRTRAEVSKIEEALRKKGIPVSSPETSIMDKAEVKLVMALLKYVASFKRRYAKAELAKLLEDKEIGDILADIANNRYDFNPFFDEENKDDETFESKGSSKTGATKSKVKPKDPDAFFADLNDKLQGLRGLNISALVKGVIAVMDVRNIVAQWGNAEIRQDNLDTLIEQALSYEQATAHSADIASVAGFIQYMNDVEIKSELDQSAKGVKVATYHKSKGLQWKIVILNSLDNDELELKDFVKKNWFGLNLRGTYGQAELQLIPTCGDVSDAMAEAVEDLSKCASGMDDNGYFNMIYGKVEGEIKRLLYVGVTRARDYFVTISMPSGQAKTTQPLSWIKNILTSSKPAVVVPAALDSPADPADKTDVDLWSVPSHPAYYEKLTDTGHSYSAKAITAVKLPPAAIDETTEAKTISPSSSKAQYDATPSLVEEFTSPYIDHKGIPDSAAFGTCIHNYMAAHRWKGTNKIKDNESANIDLAKQTVENHNMQKVLPNPGLLTQAAAALFTYLESQFGPAKELLRECPFTYCRDNGQLVQGEIDLVWKTDKDCILVDHKNFPAPAGVGKNMVLDKTNDHYVGKYFPQLGDYRAALNAAGMKVTHVFVFYAVLGRLVEVKF